MCKHGPKPQRRHFCQRSIIACVSASGCPAREQSAIRRAPFLDEPIGGDEAEAADAPTRMDAVRVDSYPLSLRGHLVPAATGGSTTILPYARILHQPEGIADFIVVEGAIVEARELAFLEERSDLMKDAPGQIRRIHSS